MIEKEESVEFNKRYITSSEIVKRLGVTRSTLLLARRRGALPGWIRIDHTHHFLWERDAIEPHLQAWDISLATRRK